MTEKEPASTSRSSLSPLALLGILAFGFILVHKIGNKHRKKPHHHGSSTVDPKPAEQGRFDAGLIYPAPVQSSAEDKQWKTEQKDFWERQITVAKVLNWLTGLAAGGAIVYASLLSFSGVMSTKIFKMRTGIFNWMNEHG